MYFYGEEGRGQWYYWAFAAPQARVASALSEGKCRSLTTAASTLWQACKRQCV